MSLLRVAALALAFSAVVFGQGANATITGTVTDQTGAVVANAAIQAKQADTGLTYDGGTSSSGNFTMANLPVGTYEISVTVAGFKKYTRPGIILTVAAVVRVDAQLEVGAASESVTVDEAAPLLETESGDISQNVQFGMVDSLPIIGLGSSLAGSSGIRNPQAATYLVPGTFVTQNTVTRVNGLPGNTYTIRVEGQPIENGESGGTQAQEQPSVDMIQEVTVQTNNFAAEYGQATGGYFNYTAKSGTNQIHMSGYDYFNNEALNATQPWDNTEPGYNKPESRRNDYGFTVGGPVVFPKIYNGRNKTFFFANWEQYLEKLRINNEYLTVPTTLYRQGNFTQVEGATNNLVVGTDSLGRNIIEGEIFDPATNNGAGVVNPFQGQIIPMSRLDPSALAIQGYVPLPGGPNVSATALAQNYNNPYFSARHTEVPAFKFDHQISTKMHVSYYWHHTETNAPLSPQLSGADGFAGPNLPITEAMGTYIYAYAQRANFDYTITPTLLFHLGVGFLHTHFDDDPLVTNFCSSCPPVYSNTNAALGYPGNVDPINSVNSGGLGIPNTLTRLFPRLVGPTAAICNNSISTGYAADTCSGAGGLKSLGTTGNRAPINYEKPHASTSLTWVKGNHTYKFGGEFKINNSFGTIKTYTSGTYTFAGNETAEPFVTAAIQNTTTVGGIANAMGFPYASFLLGLADSYRIAPIINGHMGQNATGLFAQDSWKITRKLTFNYGLRYDYQTAISPGDNASPFAQFDPNIPNPIAGGEPGAVEFNGYGPGHCNCQIAKNYPYGWAPRLGVAYQMRPKTVIRAGAGILFGIVSDSQGSSAPAAYTIPPAFTSTAFGQAAMVLSQGPVPATSFPNLNPYQFPTYPQFIGGQAPAMWMQQNAGRPPRIWEYSFGIEQEITPNTLFSVSYVGNQGVWEGADQADPNGISNALLSHYGLSLNNAANVTLLNTKLNTATANAAGFGICATCNAFGPGQGIPFGGFPLTATVAQAIRPFPQFNSIIPSYGTTGISNYNSLQIKLNKRFSHGLEVTSFYVWSKSMGTASATVPGNGTSPAFAGTVNDQYNLNQGYVISQYDEPQVLTFAPSYTTPKVAFGGNSGAYKLVNQLARDWRIGGVFSYSSGLPIPVPASNNNLNNQLLRVNAGGALSYENPTGQPFFLQDVNCHCFDPFYTQVLNPAAFTQPAAGQWGSGAPFYTQFRYQRRPNENISLGRQFTVKERYTLSIRAEFTNPFNRAEAPNPTVGSSSTPLSYQKTAGGVEPVGAIIGGYGYINPESIGTATNIQTSPFRSGQLVARFSF